MSLSDELKTWDYPGKPRKLYAVSIASIYPECEESILVYEDGTATNRWADGTAGVQQEYQDAAEELFDNDCPCVGEE
jgi:hypothetical protein